MPSKKKTNKKTRAKKSTSKKPALKKAAVAKAAPEPVVEPAAAKSEPRWEVWTVVLVIVVPLLFAFLYVMMRGDGKPVQSQQSADSGGLQVVPETVGGASSNQASGALQPQATGLQQAQQTSQSAGGLNLQAQTTPNQTTIR